MKDYEFAESSAKIIYWFILLGLTVFNFLIFLSLVPFMLVLEEWHLIIIIGALGLLFGFIFEFLIRGIEHLKPHHHVIAAIFIPLISVINIILLISLGNYLNPEKEILTASIVYVLFFTLPYIVQSFLVFVKNKKNSN